ncbi:MAG: hypothetical protein JWR10_674 [Rubritepida sp.]|nr:hypothetical protein [Rubritepida sp.]
MTDAITLEGALDGVPAKFRSRLIKSYRELKAAHNAGQHDTAGLRAGRLCEVTLRFLQQELTGAHVPFGQQMPAFANHCAKLEQLPKERGNDSLRVMLPRALSFMYTLRNKRGIGHEGGDVDANEIDSATCVRMADWCLCELIRIYHALSLEEAQALLDTISERQVPDIWTVLGKKRVLRSGLGYGDKTLLLLYSEIETAVPMEDLCDWIEHPRIRDYRKVLATLHRRRLVEYDRESETVLISPLGIQAVEADADG